MPTDTPLTARLLNKTAEVLGVHTWPRFRFNADELSEAAVRTTGLSDFGDTGYRDGLERLTDSLNEDADLHPLGHLSLHRVVLGSLENRLAYVAAKQRTPELFERSLSPPLIVLGLPRSGTTFLHRLLAADGARRAVPFWELSYPFAKNPGDTPAKRRRRAGLELGVRRLLAPDLDRKHLIRAELPEECMFGLGLTLTSSLFWILAPLYSYLRWYNGASRDRKYAEYRDLLLNWQAGDPARPLTLKAPAHLGALSELVSHVPEAHLVQTHRDPVAVVGSFQSLNHTTHAMVSSAVDVQREARANLSFLTNEVQRNLRAREESALNVYDVHYPDLLADPVSVVEGIYAHFGLTFSEAHRARLSAYLAANPQHKHGKHSYALADYGLAEREVEAQFAEYRARFF